jgi:hypothetical protein
MATDQPHLHLPTPITKPGLVIANNVLATIKYHWIHVQCKDFGGG